MGRHKDQKPVQVLWVLFQTLCSVVLLSGCGTTAGADQEIPFQSEIGARLDPQVIVMTNKDRYQPTDALGYYILNQGSKPIYFPDQSFGLRVYKYDDASKKWHRLNLGFEVAEPQPVTIQPRVTNIFSSYVFEASDIPSTGMVRVVVLGWDDPNNPEGSKIAAFVDIEISSP